MPDENTHESRGRDWRPVVENVEREFPAGSLDPSAWAFLKEHQEEPWTIACSGGADSVLLVLVVYAFFPAHRDKLMVATFDHGTRAAESEQDARFVRDLSRSLGLEVILGRQDEAEALVTSEAALRDARYQFFESEMRERGSRILLLGHHQQDVAESMIMALGRGGNVSSFASPRPVKHFANGEVRVRPLLNMHPEEIRSLLKQCRGSWREDSSNESDHYLRNRIRHQVLPELDKLFGRSFEHGAAHVRMLMEEVDDALEKAIEGMKLSVGDARILDFGAVERPPRALLRRLVIRWFSQHREVTPSPALQDTILNLLESGTEGRFQIRGEWFEVSLSRIVATGEADTETVPTAPNLNRATVPLPIPGSAYLPFGGAVHASVRWLDDEGYRALSAGEHDNAGEAFLIWDEPETLHVRLKGSGDKFRPLGSPGRRKVQDMFVDAKVPAPKRTQIPLIATQGGEILWIPGFPPCEGARVPRAGARVLHLTYEEG